MLAELQEPYPFDVSDFFKEEEPLTLGKVRIPRFGSLTVIEQELLQQFWDSNDINQMLDRDFWAGLATILLRCRYNFKWTIEYSRQLPVHLLKEAAEFFLAESRQWVSLPGTQMEDEVGKKSESIGEESGGSSDSTTPTKRVSSKRTSSTAQSG